MRSYFSHPLPYICYTNLISSLLLGGVILEQLQYKPQYFHLENGNEVELMEVGRIASFALTLKPFQDGTEVQGYVAALYDYMSKNRDHFLFNSYSLLNSDSMGKELLFSNIGLCLLEKSFREEGASENSIKAYVAVVNNYHRILNSNKEAYRTR